MRHMPVRFLLALALIITCSIGLVWFAVYATPERYSTNDTPSQQPDGPETAASTTDREDDEGQAEQREQAAPETDVLSALPHEVTVSGRTIVFDTETVPATERDAYAALPYELSIGDEAQLIETDQVLREGEGPISFVERFVTERMPQAIRLEDYDDDIYEFTVSFYEMDETEAGQYPMADEVTPAEEGVSAYVRRMNFPDDAVGGREDRFDFIRSNGGWIFVWHGERTYCRRPDAEFWQSADQVCP